MLSSILSSTPLQSLFLPSPVCSFRQNSFTIGAFQSGYAEITTHPGHLNTPPSSIHIQTSTVYLSIHPTPSRHSVCYCRLVVQSRIILRCKTVFLLEYTVVANVVITYCLSITGLARHCIVPLSNHVYDWWCCTVMIKWMDLLWRVWHNCLNKKTITFVFPFSDFLLNFQRPIWFDFNAQFIHTYIGLISQNMITWIDLAVKKKRNHNNISLARGKYAVFDEE